MRGSSSEFSLSQLFELVIQENEHGLNRDVALHVPKVASDVMVEHLLCVLHGPIEITLS